MDGQDQLPLHARARQRRHTPRQFEHQLVRQQERFPTCTPVDANGRMQQANQ